MGFALTGKRNIIERPRQKAKLRESSFRSSVIDMSRPMSKPDPVHEKPPSSNPNHE
jgi:hypothetical protein